MLVPPVLVMVSVCVPEFPIVTLPKATLVGLAVNAPAATPVPDTGIVSVEFVAFDVTVRLPLTAPADVGANETVKVALCPALIVTGVVIPLTLNPAPVIPTCVTDTLVPPVLVMVSDWVPVLPTVTLPIATLVGLALNAPAVTPVPVNAIVSDGFGASEVTVTVPVALPLAVGLKLTVNVVLCDAARVNGVVIPLTENPLPLTAT